MQAPPVERTFRWHDPPRAIKILNRFNNVYFISAIVVTFFMTFTWAKLGFADVLMVIYLIGIISMRLTMPPLYYSINQPKDANDCDCCDTMMMIHTFITWGFMGYGLMLWIASVALFSHTFIPHTWWLILTFCTVTVDFAITISLICYVNSMRIKEQNAPIQAPVQAPVPPPVNRQPVVILQLPVLEVIVEKPMAGKHQFYDNCVICLDHFKSGDDVHELGCKHIFHPACLEEWMKTRNTCPTCKDDVVNP